MKVSLSWIFDHLGVSWQKIDVPTLVARFSSSVVEIGSYEYITIDISSFTAVTVRAFNADSVIVFSQEFGREYILPSRAAQEGNIYLIKVNNDRADWVSLRDFYSTKEGFLPQVSMTDQELCGAWKNSFESEDVILEIDNVALTHRPDLWCHRGIAREIAAVLDLDLVDLESMLATVPIKCVEYHAQPTKDADFSLIIEDKKGCRRLAAVYIPQVEHEGSWLWMAHRLARIDFKPINGFVDATNYVMADLSQPLHAFDANKLAQKSLKAMRAHEGQTLDLLDGSQITLSADDLIISDGKEPIALAGIMGGVHSAVSETTEALLVEAASFDPLVIRKTTSRLKIRTEASARFEKNIDPNQNIIGLRRFLYLLDQHTELIIDPQLIVSAGPEFKAPSLYVSHEFLEKKLGISLEPAFIKHVLTKLEFVVRQTERPLAYEIQVPSFRGTKDVLAPEDIAEEVGRFYGLQKIPHKTPTLALKPGIISDVFYVDRIKYHLAFGAQMHEMCNYALFDEEFLHLIGWAPEKAVEIKNPVSSMMYRMVTSLVPNLLKNCVTNSAAYHVTNFFEYNKIFTSHAEGVHEQKSLAGVFYGPFLDFYEKKEYLTQLFELLNISVQWGKAAHVPAPWYHPYQTALLMHDTACIGVAGMANPYFLNKILPANAFIFELNADVLISAVRPITHCIPLAKYQDTWADVSILVPTWVTASSLQVAIEAAHDYIFDVQLVDFFEKPEWKDQRSLTFRYYARAADRTLDHNDIKAIYTGVVAALTQLGAVIR